jgi:hypothetical protein
VSPAVAERLANRNIQVAAEATGHYLFVRENFIALVERKADGFGSIGSTGIMTETGLAYLIWREDRPLLVGKGTETIAEPSQVDAIRQFSEDLKAALAA